MSIVLHYRHNVNNAKNLHYAKKATYSHSEGNMGGFYCISFSTKMEYLKLFFLKI